MKANTFIGKPCKKCGRQERYVSTNKCCQCWRERARRRYHADPKEKKRSRRWRLANPERVRENNHRWRLKHPERAKELSRRWRLKNPEKQRERQRRWYRASPEKIRELWRKKSKQQTEKMSNAYVRRLLKFAGIFHPSPELIAAKRAHIQLLRLVRNTQQPTGETV